MYVWYFSMTLKIFGFGFWRSAYLTAYLKFAGKDHPDVIKARADYAKSFRTHPSSQKIFERN